MTEEISLKKLLDKTNAPSISSADLKAMQDTAAAEDRIKRGKIVNYLAENLCEIGIKTIAVFSILLLISLFTYLILSVFNNEKGMSNVANFIELIFGKIIYPVITFFVGYFANKANK